MNTFCNHGAAFQGCSPERHALIRYGKTPRKVAGKLEEPEALGASLKRAIDFTVQVEGEKPLCACCRQPLI